METLSLAYAILISTLIGGSALIKIYLKITGNYQDTRLKVQQEELITIPFIILGLLGTFGFALKIPIFGQVFWQLYFTLLLLHTFLAFLLPKMRLLKESMSIKQFVLLNIISLLVGAPMYCMLWAYAFRSFPITSMG